MVTVLIRISDETKLILDSLKIHHRETYDDSMNKEIENQIQSETKPKSIQGADELKLSIQTALAELKPADKKIMAKKLSDKGLSTKYKEIEDLGQLREILSTLKGE